MLATVQESAGNEDRQTKKARRRTGGSELPLPAEPVVSDVVHEVGKRPLELVLSAAADPDNIDGTTGAVAPAVGNDGVDERAFQRLYEEVRPKLCRFLAYRGVPIEDAEDMIQDVFTSYFRKHEEVEKPKQWLNGAIKNVYFMYCRTRGRSFVQAVDDAILEHLARGQAPTQEGAVFRDNLNQLIKQLKWRCREILRLRYGLGFDARETAEALRYKRSSIDKVHKRCLRDLGRKLDVAATGLMSLKGGSA